MTGPKCDHMFCRNRRSMLGFGRTSVFLAPFFVVEQISKSRRIPAERVGVSKIGSVAKLGCRRAKGRPNPNHARLFRGQTRRIEPRAYLGLPLLVDIAIELFLGHAQSSRPQMSPRFLWSSFASDAEEGASPTSPSSPLSLASRSYPSAGSAGHATRSCRPCAFARSPVFLGRDVGGPCGHTRIVLLARSHASKPPPLALCCTTRYGAASFTQ